MSSLDELKAGDVCVYNVSKSHTQLVWDKVARTTATTIVTENGRRFSRIRGHRELKSDKASDPCGKLWSVEHAHEFEARYNAANVDGCSHYNF